LAATKSILFVPVAATQMSFNCGLAAISFLPITTLLVIAISQSANREMVSFGRVSLYKITLPKDINESMGISPNVSVSKKQILVNLVQVKDYVNIRSQFYPIFAKKLHPHGRPQ